VHISVGELAQKIKGLTGSTADPVHTPSRPGAVRDSLADVRKSIDAGLVQDPIPLDEGLASTVNWYRSHR
ncbi:MAG: GDP-mannose 4,6-dehydratase, partial [Candidatus Margulisiibacteriota bacterium]